MILLQNTKHSENQYRFVRNEGTKIALAIVVKIIQKNLNERVSYIETFLDLAKLLTR